MLDGLPSTFMGPQMGTETRVYSFFAPRVLLDCIFLFYKSSAAPPPAFAPTLVS